MEFTSRLHKLASSRVGRVIIIQEVSCGLVPDHGESEQEHIVQEKERQTMTLASYLAGFMSNSETDTRLHTFSAQLCTQSSGVFRYFSPEGLPVPRNESNHRLMLFL